MEADVRWAQRATVRGKRNVRRNSGAAQLFLTLLQRQSHRRPELLPEEIVKGRSGLCLNRHCLQRTCPALEDRTEVAQREARLGGDGLCGGLGPRREIAQLPDERQYRDDVAGTGIR